MVEEIKKKRGRKPKDPVQKKADIEGLVSKKTDRKHRVVFSFDNQKNEEELDVDDNVILKLKVPTDEAVINAIGHCMIDDHNENVGAYNECHMYNFSSLNMDNVVYEQEKPEENVKKVGNNKVVELLREFDKKTKNDEWPTSTSIACFWCCHKFDNPPVGLPCKYYKSRFYVMGCFCSLECASAYNIMQLKDSHIEERNNLLNYLSNRLGYTSIIKTSPPREMLQMFGGNMSIEEFRTSNTLEKSIHVNFPPMTVLISQFEEINDSDISSNLKYIPLDTGRIDKYQEKMRLERNRPVNQHKNTLENVMQFSITES
jgi:hypothetical protein